MNHRFAALLVAAAATIVSTPAAAQRPCDRACLDGITAQFIQALAVNDASRLPLADGFRYTENGQTLEWGNGLWGTLSAYAGQDWRTAPAARELDYRISLADPATGTIATALEIDENGTRGVLVLRLKIVAAKIAEAEAIVVREEASGHRAGTVTLFQPPLLVTMDGQLVGPPDALFTADPTTGTPATTAAAMTSAATAYWTGLLAGRSKGVPIAADCQRRDNGVRTTGRSDAPPLDPKVKSFRPFELGCAAQIDSGFYTYLSRTRDQRFLADPEKGLLMSIELVDNPGTTMALTVKGVGKVDYPGPRKPAGGLSGEQFDNRGWGPNLIAPATGLSVTFYRFVDGKIARLDGFQRAGPYGLRSGWAK